ncbi:MAG: HAMP domain-containing protein [Gemmatimonadaceae bacterium]|nr:HAMP domain-containing protein [Gemmatimonadaceae bacterium]
MVGLRVERRIAEAEARARALRLGALVRWLLRLPLAWKLAGANLLVVLVAGLALWVVHAPLAGAWGVLLIAVVALAAALLVNIALVLLALAPLNELEAAVRRVWTGDLEARVAPSPLADAELARVGRTLNLLLDGLMADRGRMRALAAEVIRSGDRERAQLAHELHDSTAQSLAALVYQLTALEQHRATGGELPSLDPVCAAAGAILEEVRLLANTVHPRILDDLGLIPALRHLVRSAAEHCTVDIDVAVEGQAAESAKGLSPEGASVLYRVAQEAVRNALQHAGARRIALRVSDGGGAVAVRISDDGCGFDLAEAERRRPGMGLFTMRERTTLVGGQFEVITSEGQGTSVLARIPVAGAGPQAS